MKTIDFSFTGGFPLTQDELNYLQQAYSECIMALAATGLNGSTPCIVTGMGISYPGGGAVTTTNGWLVYNGDMIPFTGSTVTPTGSDVAMVQIANVATNLVYNDGGVHPAIKSKVATLTTGPSATTAMSFPLSAAMPYTVLLGLNGRESGWGSLTVNTLPAQGSVSGNIFYKKNLLTNTLHLRGALTANAAQNFSASPGALNYLMATLPAGYLPANSGYFTAYYFGSNLFKDDMGVAWIKQFTSILNVAGQIYINFIKPDAAISAFSVVFNTIMPLD